jgi:3-deoxy-D-manno-octulosonic-acid transferase
VDERFGHYSQPRPERAPGEPLVWIHAVSLGETRAAAILLASAAPAQLPGMRLLLTHGTATGRAEGIGAAAAGRRAGLAALGHARRRAALSARISGPTSAC